MATRSPSIPWTPVPGVEAGEVVYGLFGSAATIGAVGLHVGSLGRLAAIWCFVVVTYWLAHVYVNLVTHPFEGVRAGLGVRVATAFRSEMGVVVGALPGLVVIVLVGLLDGEPKAAASSTLFLTIGLLFAAGAYSARRVGASALGALGEGVLASSLGVVMVIAKSFLH